MNDGKPDGAVVVFRDISQRREIERQREEAYAEIEKLKEQLEQERDYLRDEVEVTVNFGEIIGTSMAQLRPTECLGLRLEARAFGTLLNSETDLFCRTGPDINICAVRVDGTVLWQLETFAGLVFRF